MALTEQQRGDLHAALMQDMSRTFENVTITKADLQAAINALDDFLEADADALNTAIPQPAREALTVSQKAKLLAAVAVWRCG